MNRPATLHSAFALTIASEVPLIEVPVGEGVPDVFVRVDTIEDAVAPSQHWVIDATPQGVRGWIPRGGAFRVTGGREIVIDRVHDADELALRLAIVGPLFGVILMQRGCFVLHASTVAIDGRAVAFFGPSGRGKSTMSAALTRAGYPLIADDMTVIDTTHGAPMVIPGFPRVKLWPDSAAALQQDPDALPLIHPDTTKRSLDKIEFHRQPLPLARCYLLEEADAESVSEIEPREAIVSLIASTYQAPWVHQAGASGANLVQCGALLRSGVVRRLRRRRSFDVLDDVVRFVEADVRASQR